MIVGLAAILFVATTVGPPFLRLIALCAIALIVAELLYVAGVVALAIGAALLIALAPAFWQGFKEGWHGA